ncbi:formimidoylglutamate deiminase [Paraburkholderia lycopersici]|uniref:Formimidoylglutamate deiminase n=1 Tax=Paraburkholderia lycopersici TaxID=416944 RepID=A0A1G6WZG5_9BURK|nr:formimidoylglutamate deiminase [Paraburkholderia lycopersici]SDD71360.1 formimidoylglutamate deiminase [Paraburkholderia lycopersici]
METPTHSLPLTNALFAEHAWLPGGWRRGVLLEWDAAGTLRGVTAGLPEAPAGVACAAGPLVPGMPNLHSHAFQRAMAGLTEYRANPSDSFWSWRDLMYRFAARVTPDDLGAIASWLYVEMLKAGYTSVCEFHYVHHAQDGRRYARPAEMALRVVDAAAETGIGLTMLPVLYQYSGFGGQRPRDDQRRFVNTPEQLLAIVESLRRVRAEHDSLRYGVAPHSLRAVSQASLRTLVEGLDAMLPGAPVHIHVAEQTAEVEACLAAEGARPVQWLLDRFDVNARWCLVHATHVDRAETLALAKRGAVAGLCLTTEANLGDGIFPACDYLEAQGAFGVGSDSHIGVDWRAELRLLEYGQRLVRRERNVLASAQTAQVADRLFGAALAGGARASGRAVGALEEGARADWLVLDPQHPNLAQQAPQTWLSAVVFCEHGETPVRDVYVGGEQVVSQRRHRDEARLYAGYRRALNHLVADA